MSNTFYEWVLGPSMTYTCACYPRPDASLEEAQENKCRLVVEKLRLKPGDRLLDVGCGWGGMVRYAARRGVEATGVTLSEQQTAWVQRAIAAEGLTGLAEVRFGDYRDIQETGFDAVSSIGLLEHIGVRNYPSYFDFLQSRMRPGGLLLNHCITRPDNRSEASPRGFIDRYVFPDGELTGSGQIISAAQDVGLEVMHEENLRTHYAMTLRDWCTNLVEHWDEAVAEVGLHTAKVWGLYMAGSRLAFETGGIQLHQVLAVKPDAGGGVDLLSVTLNDDEASSSLTMSFGGVVGTVTWWSSAVTAGIVVVVTMTAVFGHARAPQRWISGAQGWGQEPASGEHADQRPHWQRGIPTLLAGQRRAGEEIQCVPERSRPDQVAVQDVRIGTVRVLHALFLQPVGVWFPRPPQPAAHRGDRAVQLGRDRAVPVAAGLRSQGRADHLGRVCPAQNQSGGQQHVRGRAGEAAGTAGSHRDRCLAEAAHPADAAIPARA
nr:class I SAM-dependent methyltransferase [Cryobacterium shii]